MTDTPDDGTVTDKTALALELAWGLIANAYGGNWDEDPEWKEAAIRWRDYNYHPWLDAQRNADGAGTPGIDPEVVARLHRAARTYRTRYAQGGSATFEEGRILDTALGETYDALFPKAADDSTDDETAEEVQAAFDAGEKGVTARPFITGMTSSTYTCAKHNRTGCIECALPAEVKVHFSASTGQAAPEPSRDCFLASGNAEDANYCNRHHAPWPEGAPRCSAVETATPRPERVSCERCSEVIDLDGKGLVIEHNGRRVIHAMNGCYDIGAHDDVETPGVTEPTAAPVGKGSDALRLRSCSDGMYHGAHVYEHDAERFRCPGRRLIKGNGYNTFDTPSAPVYPVEEIMASPPIGQAADETGTDQPSTELAQAWEDFREIAEGALTDEERMEIAQEAMERLAPYARGAPA